MATPPFTELNEIARGGFGRVARVQDRDGNLFAIKFLLDNQNGGAPLEDLIRRFAREVKYQKSINHPNVVPIYYADTDATPPYCVMHLAQGTLADDLAVDRTLGGDPKHALFDILSGLEQIEAKGFTHRDLKPQNVLRFDLADGTTRYAISDFGLMHPGETDTTTLTATGTQGGTAMYSAPELMMDLGSATTAADIYSFGAILHDIFVAQYRVPYTPLAGAGKIGKVIEKCTKQLPIRRYATISELREDLFEALADVNLVFTSGREQLSVELLTSGKPLTADEWDYVMMAFSENDSKGAPSDNLLRALRGEHIEMLATDSPQLVKAIGKRFSDFCIERTFDFDYCDVLASRLTVIFDAGDVELKANVLLALIELGVSHNRWMVERHFYRRVLADADSNVMQRFVVEADVRGYDLKAKIKSLNSSITADSDSYHPILKAALE